MAVPLAQSESPADFDDPHHVVGKADPPYGPESEPR